MDSCPAPRGAPTEGKAMTALSTRFTVTDAAGKPLCHSPAMVKRNADSRRKRAVREAFEMMCVAAGFVRGEGAEREWLDVSTGAWLPMADCDTRSTDWGTVERGHVISDAADGAFCPCNLVPQNKGANKANGNRSLDPRDFRTADPREAWREVWMNNYATPAKRRKAQAASEA